MIRYNIKVTNKTSTLVVIKEFKCDALIFCIFKSDHLELRYTFPKTFSDCLVLVDLSKYSFSLLAND